MCDRTFQIFCEVGVDALELFVMELKGREKALDQCVFSPCCKEPLYMRGNAVCLCSGIMTP